MSDNKGICPECGKIKSSIMSRNIGDGLYHSCFECYKRYLEQLNAHGESILDRVRRLLRNGKD